MRQLADDTLVAAVETLRVLELLYRVKAEVEVPALDVVLIELRQFPETIELALDATGTALRVLWGETPRLYLLSGDGWCSRLGDDLRASDLLLALDMAKGDPRRPRLPGDWESPAKAGAECGGGLSPMIRSVTLLAVVDLSGGGPLTSRAVGGGTSSTGDIRPDTEALTLFLPKLSFHFDGFLLGAGGVGGAGTTGTGGGAVLRTDDGGALRIDGDEALRTGDERTPVRGAASKAEGMAKIATGSNGSRARLVEELEAFVDTDLWVDEDLDALLISRANDCEASARLASVSSLELVAIAPLPFRAPLFLRLLVDVDLDASRSRPWLYGSSISCSCSWSMTVDRSESSCCSYAGPSEGARERERDCIAGVRPVVAIPEGCLEEGR